MLFGDVLGICFFNAFEVENIVVLRGSETLSLLNVIVLDVKSILEGIDLFSGAQFAFIKDEGFDAVFLHEKSLFVSFIFFVSLSLSCCL